MCRSNTNGLSASRALCGRRDERQRPENVSFWRVEIFILRTSNLLLVRVQQPGDVLGGGRGQAQQVPLQLGDLEKQQDGKGPTPRVKRLFQLHKQTKPRPLALGPELKVAVLNKLGCLLVGHGSPPGAFKEQA
ncbi:hypothetical protein EYF80_066305 [Liparis tanakae]|uniref:Uncharacterized protein n=1 Tax=Liparis tanakae TaxID=230148 RepID=A0A4Z2E4G0_9TELE|nr:hypothetical protein EYF80_066305 [Liparis tanakae]